MNAKRLLALALVALILSACAVAVATSFAKATYRVRCYSALVQLRESKLLAPNADENVVLAELENIPANGSYFTYLGVLAVMLAVSSSIMTSSYVLLSGRKQ